ncbi:Sec-independent protein translocase protein TatB [Paracoccus sp. Z118]|uniref:Sec-independent protein translocase protein TatB n=1 Tax=Paracoccus sp. Z118 TaxID=2851017 RepID=UPI001C2C9912|nr:Sec-independent protein translocase protein TatB [Paracoccus sp. Z118]MBV0890554.1 Sec-independent protein translocase protein TatB [Paracoccus sp. Z118]
MLDVGWSELLLIGIVALIVIGPEDLPRMFRALGRITARARSMAREFSMAMDDAAKSSGIEDAAGSLREVKNLTSKKALGLDALDKAAEKFEKWDPKLPRNDGGLRADPAASAPPAAPSAAAGHTVATLQAAPQPAAPAPQPAAKPPVPGSSPATPPAAEAPGPRRLHAVRRAEPKDR